MFVNGFNFLNKKRVFNIINYWGVNIFTPMFSCARKRSSKNDRTVQSTW